MWDIYQNYIYIDFTFKYQYNNLEKKLNYKNKVINVDSNKMINGDNNFNTNWKVFLKGMGKKII